MIRLGGTGRVYGQKHCRGETNRIAREISAENLNLYSK